MAGFGTSYATVDELKAHLKITKSEPDKDSRLADNLAAASREVEGECGRQFNRVEVASVRTYTPKGRKLIIVDDFYTRDDLQIRTAQISGSFGTPWNPQGYLLAPENGVVDGVPGWPYRRITLTFSNTWLYCDERVEVTAKWGWAEVPAPVKQATLLLAARYFKLGDAPLGNKTGFSETGGTIPIKDFPEVCRLLKPFKVESVMVA